MENITTEETLKADYNHNWKDLVSYEGYLSIKAQQATFESNAKGYERMR